MKQPVRYAKAAPTKFKPKASRVARRTRQIALHSGGGTGYRSAIAGFEGARAQEEMRRKQRRKRLKVR